MIEISDLVFEYPTRRALDHVSCTIRPRSVTALVGPNGAGKTTIIRCIVGLSTPFHGTVTFEGVDIHRNVREVHRRMGYLSDFFGVYENLTVRQCLIFTARAYAVEEGGIEAAIGSVADRLGITGYLDQKAGTLSRGLRQRLAIAQAIIHGPSFVALDEPASGLDPEARQELSHLLIGLRDEGMTILVSSHILAELESYCTEMLVMREGRIVSQESLEHREDAAGRRLRLDLAAPHPTLVKALAAIDGVSGAVADGLSATFDFTGDAAERHALLRRLIEGGVPVSGLRDDRIQLQDAYFATVRDAEGDGQ